jgi:hypothetical protein
MEDTIDFSWLQTKPDRGILAMYNGLPTHIGVWSVPSSTSKQPLIHDLYYKTTWVSVDLPDKSRETLLGMFDRFHIASIESIRVSQSDLTLEFRLLLSSDIYNTCRYHAFYVYK